MRLLPGAYETEEVSVERCGRECRVRVRQVPLGRGAMLVLISDSTTRHDVLVPEAI